MTTTTEPTTRRTWSVTAARTYATCPRQWSYRAGPHYTRMIDRVTPVHRKRGRALHDAIGAAWQACQQEASANPDGYPTPEAGETMLRYREAAEKALNVAWTAHTLPRDAGLAQATLGTLLELLGREPVPVAWSVAEVEAEHRFTTAAGLPVVIRPDLVFSTADGMVIRDWKYGNVAARVPATDHQLNVYVVGLAHRYPQVRRFDIEFRSISGATVVSARAQPEQAAAALNWLEATAQTAEADTVCEPRPSDECGWCPFRPICPAV